MKKILLFMMSVLFMMSCGENTVVTGGQPDEGGSVQPAEQRATQVYIQ